MRVSFFPTLRLAPLLAVLFVAACAGAPPPQDSFHRLEGGAPSRSFEAPPLDGMVEVLRFSTAAMLDDRPLVYSEDGGQSLTQHNYHFWTEAPTVMLRDALVDTLRATNAAERVATREMRVQPDFRLEGRLLRLEQHVGETEDTVLVAVELALRRAGAEDFLLLKTYREQETLLESSPNAAARSMQAALDRILESFIADLDESQDAI